MSSKEDLSHSRTHTRSTACPPFVFKNITLKKHKQVINLANFGATCERKASQCQSISKIKFMSDLTFPSKNINSSRPCLKQAREDPILKFSQQKNYWIWQ